MIIEMNHLMNPFMCRRRAPNVFGVTLPSKTENIRASSPRLLLLYVLASLLIPKLTAAGAGETNEYAAVNAIFTEHCLDCHGAQDPEGHFVLEDFDSLRKGGEIGPAWGPGRGGE